jgi:hypothetical protein
MRIYLDIETLPDGEPDYSGLVDPESIVVMLDDREVTPNRTLKDPEKIDADLERKRAALQTVRREKAIKARQDIDETWRKGSLSAIRGRILCVSIAVDEGPVKVLWGEDEYATLSQLQKGLMHYAKHRPVLTTYNGNSFDLPFIARRALRHQLYDLARICKVGKKWDAGDLYVAWGMGDMRAQGKLDDVCELLGIKRLDNPITGAEVLDRYLAGDHDAIREHAIDDVRVLQLIAKEFDKAGWI